MAAARAHLGTAAAPPLPAARERGRKRVVRLILVIYLLAIFEGALRKWALPHFSQVIFFVRDPFVFLTYLIATRHRLWPKHSTPFTLGLIAAAVGGLVGVLQIALGGFENTQMLLAGYGWRNYFLYLPLGFLIGAQFSRADVDRLLRITLWLALPVALLVVLQFRAPLDAPINVGIASDTAAQFRGLGLDADHTRPMGTFTSVTGQTMFLASAFAALLGFIITPARVRPVGRLLLLAAALGILTGVGLGGSRFTFLHCAVAVAGSMTLGLLGRGAGLKWRALVLPALLVVVALALYPIVLPQGYAALSARVAVANAVESQGFEGGVIGRALFGLIDFVRLLRIVPALGYGLGYGGNASTTLGATIDGVVPLELAESDWARHIIDLGPLFGCMFIAYRIGLTAWLGLKVLRATRRAADPQPMLLFAFLGIELLYGQVTGQGTVNIYVWIFMGLCLATLNPRATKARPQAIRRAARQAATNDALAAPDGLEVRAAR